VDAAVVELGGIKLVGAALTDIALGGVDEADEALVAAAGAGGVAGTLKETRYSRNRRPRPQSATTTNCTSSVVTGVAVRMRSTGAPAED
jgi:hypothetical protein